MRKYESGARMSRSMTGTHNLVQALKCFLRTQCLRGPSARGAAGFGGHVCHAVCRISRRTGRLPQVMAPTAMHSWVRPSKDRSGKGLHLLDQAATASPRTVPTSTVSNAAAGQGAAVGTNRRCRGVGLMPRMLRQRRGE
jgi:hypothetical protein